jgi:1-deoxy-D-xylulose-5-phosphate reductoisomerase
MKRKIAILGSTGSIGRSTIEILKKNKNKFEIFLLTADENINELTKQIKEFKVKNLIINNKKHFKYLKKKFKNKDINIYNNLDDINKIFNKKIDYCMSCISGLAGLKPTLDMIKYTRTIAIANKESLICAWNIIDKNLKKNKTKFIPVDSEHFSIWSLINDHGKNNIDKIYITASGGPFLNLPLNKFKTITPAQAIKHPKWNMGKKISIDSATLMNKVFEVIEAQRIFDIDINKFKILTHPNSYVHAIVKFNNGLTKVLIHDTDMKIPIFNSIYVNDSQQLQTNELNIKKLNNLEFKDVKLSRFPSIKILDTIPKKNSLFETVIVTANDELVKLFLANKIKYLDIVKNLSIILKLKKFNKYKLIYPRNFNQIKKLNMSVRLKINSLYI